MNDIGASWHDTSISNQMLYNNFLIQPVQAASGDASDKNPLAFGTEQCLIDFSRLTWKSMKSDNVPAESGENPITGNQQSQSLNFK